jgi:hypothetical protein
MIWTTLQQVAEARTGPVISPASLNPAAATLLSAAIPPSTNRQLLEALLNPHAADIVFEHVRNGAAALDGVDIASILTFAAFPITYLHSDIAAMLTTTTLLSTRRTVKPRVESTEARIGRILNHLGDDEDGLIVACQIGFEHMIRQLPLGGVNAMNQVSLAFTLLTFSLIPLQSPQLGPVSHEIQNRWMLLWYELGRLIGIGPGGLPQTREEGNALMNLLLATPQASQISPAGQRLVTAFVQAYSPNSVKSIRTYAGLEWAERLGVA